MPQLVLNAFGIDEKESEVVPFGTGLINDTWKVINHTGTYILQRVNNTVFKQPHDIANNISLVANHLAQHFPEYRFIAPVAAQTGEELVYSQGDGYYRMFPFVQGSLCHDVVENPSQAGEAARQFGRFTRLLSGFDVSKLKITIPSFHDLALRYQQFLLALESGNAQRIEASKELIATLKQHSVIVDEYISIRSNAGFKLRVTHHDTKISNVLFDNNDKGICVIDLDTLMPGFFISDVGDMMRTYLSPVSEEESDYSKIEVRADFYRAIVRGYFNEMKEELTPTEKGYFFYAGKFMIYMQALRFLTDYLSNDVYYGERYSGQNFTRAKNQLVLLHKLLEKEQLLSNIDLYDYEGKRI
ncbi:MAG: aminoglycoside phosphotransferase family protein [Bacteroidota bacterium]